MGFRSRKPASRPPLPAPECWPQGYGLERADSPELAAVADRLNADYAGLDAAVDALEPILNLLDSGFYVVADAAMYPADGNGHFFWASPATMTENPATAEVLINGYECIGGFPAFLYPTQPGDHLDERRVRYYIDRFAEGPHEPRAVSYHLAEFVSVLLDGHHKAAAAARMGRAVRCVDIIPMMVSRGSHKVAVVPHCSGLTVSMKDVRPAVRWAGSRRIRHKAPPFSDAVLPFTRFDRQYEGSALNYPTVSELAESIATGVGEITDALIAECMTRQDEWGVRRLRHIVSALARRGDARARELALACGRNSRDPGLREICFRTLAQWKDDEGVEALFVDYLVDHTDPHDPVKQIVDRYWEASS